jgi:hypothetical protein
MRKYLVGCLALALALTPVSPAQAADGLGPIAGTLRISPSVVDTTSSDATVSVSLSVSDETGVRYAIINCFDSDGYNPLWVEIKPRNNLGNPQVLDAARGGDLAIERFSGDQTNFSIQFRAIITKGDFPGTYSCHLELTDTLWNETAQDSGTGITIVRSSMDLPSQTPDPISTPRPTPTPLPTPIQAAPTLCKVPYGTKCLDNERFIFTNPTFKAIGRGGLRIKWGTVSLGEKNMGYTVLERKRGKKRYKMIVSKSKSMFFERRGLKPGVYDYLVRATLRSGLTREIIISGRVR